MLAADGALVSSTAVPRAFLELPARAFHMGDAMPAPLPVVWSPMHAVHEPADREFLLEQALHRAHVRPSLPPAQLRTHALHSSCRKPKRPFECDSCGWPAQGENTPFTAQQENWVENPRRVDRLLQVWPTIPSPPCHLNDIHDSHDFCSCHTGAEGSRWGGGRREEEGRGSVAEEGCEEQEGYGEGRRVPDRAARS